MRAVFAAVVGLVAAGAAAQERMAIWSGWAEDGYGGAADCTECFESEYVLMGCQSGSDEVRAEILGLLPPEGVGGRVPVRLAVDGVEEDREAAIEFSEILGKIPVLTVARDDPLFERLRGGTELALSLGGDRVEIPLTGVGEALDVMFAACR